MKAMNVHKHVGKEVVIKSPLDEVTNFNGISLNRAEISLLNLTPLSILDGVLNGNRDVRIRNGENNIVFVNHKFIKLKREPKSNVETNPYTPAKGIDFDEEVF